MLAAKRDTVPMINPKSYALQLTGPIRDKKRERNRLRRLVQNHPNLSTVHTPTINRLTAEIRSEANEIRNEDFANKIEAIPENDREGKIWKVTKLLKKRRDFMPPLKDEDNNIHLTPQEKCDLLADQFSKNYDNPLKDDNKSHTRRVKSRVKRYVKNASVDPSYATINDIRSEVRNLKNNTAPGYDQIQTQLVKNLPDTALFVLLIIINSCLLLSYFPPKWKHSKMIAIKKPDKPGSQPSSYRPISLLSVLSKILERIVLNQIKCHLDDFNISPDIQHGFRAGYSTNTQLHLITETINTNLMNKLSTGIVLMDIEKAFDRV